MALYFPREFSYRQWQHHSDSDCLLDIATVTKEGLAKGELSDTITHALQNAIKTDTGERNRENQDRAGCMCAVRRFIVSERNSKVSIAKKFESEYSI